MSKIERLFRIDFYPQDWLIDTARLAPVDRGIFIQIVCLIYANRGAIENDPSWIAGVSGTSKTVVKSSIIRLISAGFLTENEGKITQKRAQNEINSKQNHLENSAKGGKNKASRAKENNDLNSSDHQEPQSTPSPSPNPSPSPTAKEDQDQAPKSKQPKTPRMDLLNFNVRDLMDEDGFQDARVFASVMGQTVDDLAIAYNNAVKNGDLDPPRDANKAFPAWIESLAKRKQNRRSR